MPKCNNNILITALMLCVSLIGFHIQTVAAWAATGKGGGNISTDISSTSMRYDDARQTVIFEGAVHVKRPDFELWADKITLYFLKKDQTTKNADGSRDENDSQAAARQADQGLGMRMQSGSIDRIVAENSVRIVKEDKVGTANKGTYFIKTGILTMEGDPVIQDGKKNSIRGQIIKFYINENRSEVLGGVKATFSGEAGSGDLMQGGKPKKNGK